MRKTYSFANIAEASNDSNLSSKHDIGGTLNAVYKGLAAAIVVVKFGLGNRIVNADDRDREPTLTESLVECDHTTGGLFGDAFDICRGKSRSMGNVEKKSTDWLPCRY